MPFVGSRTGCTNSYQLLCSTHFTDKSVKKKVCQESKPFALALFFSPSFYDDSNSPDQTEISPVTGIEIGAVTIFRLHNDSTSLSNTQVYYISVRNGMWRTNSSFRPFSLQFLLTPLTGKNILQSVLKPVVLGE